MTINLDRSVDELTSCPVGGAFLALVDTNLTVEQAVTPHASFELAAQALGWLSPWATNYERMLELTLRLGGELRELARELLSHPGAIWWSAPFEGPQLWIGYGNHPNAPREQSQLVDEAARRRRETYSQRPIDWQLTSRMFEGLACLDFVARSGEWAVAPRSRAPIEPIEGARVHEIGSPADWHRLCVEYVSLARARRDDPAGEGSIAPDWSAVRRDWDAVHLSFLGLLTTPFVRTETAAGASMLWSWDSEGTIWLRREFLRPAREPIPLDDAEDPTDRLSLLPGPLFDPNDPSTRLFGTDHPAPSI